MTAAIEVGAGPGAQAGSAEGDGSPGTSVVSVDGRQVAYAEYGDSDGTPVVFLHGTPGSRRLAGLFDKDAREADVRLLAPDRPGYGQSESWPDRAFADTGDVVAAVLDDAGVDAADVVGFSGGGPHALAVAATRGDLIEQVHVVSGSPPPELADETPAVVRVFGALAGTTPRLLRMMGRAQAWVAGRMAPSFVVSQYTTSGAGTTVSDDDAELLKADFLAAFAGDGAGFVTESRLLAGEWEFSADAVSVPTTLWHGTRDENAPVAGARALVDRLPDARLRTVDDADHLGTLLRAGPEILAR